MFMIGNAMVIPCDKRINNPPGIDLNAVGMAEHEHPTWMLILT